MINNYDASIEFTISQIIRNEKRRKKMFINKLVSNSAIKICIFINLVIFAMGLLLETSPDIVELITLRLQPLINCIFLMSIDSYNK